VPHDDAFLRAIFENPGDDAPRLIYADWLDERGDSDRAELIRVSQAMRRVPVFSDDYWRLKVRRNQLRPRCPADWLAATGYDGSRYDPLYRDGIPPDWKGRWRLIREFTERWYGTPMGDVGGQRDAARAESRRLRRRLPPSVREYIAYAHDVAPPGQVGIVHRDEYTMRPMEEHQSLSVMRIAEGNVQWAIRDSDLGRPDPPVYAFYWADGDETRYVPAAGEGPEAPSLSDFVLGFVTAYKHDGGRFRTTVRDARGLREQLEAAFPVRLVVHRGTTYEGDRILVNFGPELHGPGLDLEVCVHRSMTWERVPQFVWPYAWYAHVRGGMFLTAEDLRVSRGHWGDQPPADVLTPAPPPMQHPPATDPRGEWADADLPF
jgi:uncharacterized protein (TIGR02996 family)